MSFSQIVSHYILRSTIPAYLPRNPSLLASQTPTSSATVDFEGAHRVPHRSGLSSNLISMRPTTMLEIINIRAFNRQRRKILLPRCNHRHSRVGDACLIGNDGRTEIVVDPGIKNRGLGWNGSGVQNHELIAKRSRSSLRQPWMNSA